MCTIDPNQGRQWGPPASGWNNAVLIGSGSSILVDGAKRDRTIWVRNFYFLKLLLVLYCIYIYIYE